MNLWVWGVLVVVSAVCYRIGGAHPSRIPWLPKWLFHGWVRDVGCVACAAYVLGKEMGVSAPWWAWALFGGLMYGALTTYWDFLTGDDNHWAHGLGIGLSTIPLVVGGVQVQAVLAYAVVLWLLMGWWSEAWSNDHVEELGRGAFIVAMVPLLDLWR